jgi:hypothetical protein
MKEHTPGTLVESPTTSLASPQVKSRQLSEPDVVALSTQIAEQLSENSEAVIVLMTILQGITENTLNPDVLALAIYRAKDMCVSLGVDEDTFEDTVQQYLRFAQTTRARNPLRALWE